MTETKVCTACGHVNDAAAAECSACNAPLGVPPEAEARTMAIDMSSIAALDALLMAKAEGDADAAVADGDDATAVDTQSASGDSPAEAEPALEAAPAMDAPEAAPMSPPSPGPAVPELSSPPKPGPTPPMDMGYGGMGIEDKPDRTLLYVGIGVGVLLLFLCCCVLGAAVVIPGLGGAAFWSTSAQGPETSSRAAAKTRLTLMRDSITDSEAKWVVGSSGNLLFMFHLDKNLGDKSVPGYTQSSNVNSIYYKLP